MGSTIPYTGNVRVTVLRGKESWKLGVKEHYKVTLHSKPHTRVLLGKTHCLEEKQQRMEQESDFV